jgi:hypothetical protein
MARHIGTVREFYHNNASGKEIIYNISNLLKYYATKLLFDVKTHNNSDNCCRVIDHLEYGEVGITNFFVPAMVSCIHYTNPFQ